MLAKILHDVASCLVTWNKENIDLNLSAKWIISSVGSATEKNLTEKYQKKIEG